MQIALTEESHNHVDWEAKRPVVWMEVGLLAALLVLALLVIPSPSQRRWLVLGGAAAVFVALGVLLAATSPLADRGHLERLPEGGDLKRSKVWILVGERLVVDQELDGIAGFEVEQATFEDAPPATYDLARLWAVSMEGHRFSLTEWAEPESVLRLEKALERALRRQLSVE